MVNKLILGDCLDKMKSIPDSSIDMILCDLPYGTTVNKWDILIPFSLLWNEYERIIKKEKKAGAIVLTSINPFTANLILSNTDLFKYSLVWGKTKVNHFAQAPYRFLTVHEDICVFSFGGCSKNAKLRMKYNPQGIIEIKPKMVRGKGHSDHRPSNIKQKPYIQTVTGYPKSILHFDSVNNPIHPTEKPVALFEYLINTYTDEGDIVLDNCCGSGTTAIACINTDRKYICIEKEEKYFQIARERIFKHKFPDLW